MHIVFYKIWDRPMIIYSNIFNNSVDDYSNLIYTIMILYYILHSMLYNITI